MIHEKKDCQYTGNEIPDSPELIAKIHYLSLPAQSVLYALLLEDGEEASATRAGVDITDVEEACSSCSLDETEPERAIQAGVMELEQYGYVEERGGRLFLKTRVEHMRTFEKAVESSAYVVRQ
ncbi:MAG: hypothetical protein ACXVIG_08185 [Halobacteriota archaeon]